MGVVVVMSLLVTPPDVSDCDESHAQLCLLTVVVICVSLIVGVICWLQKHSTTEI